MKALQVENYEIYGGKLFESVQEVLDSIHDTNDTVVLYGLGICGDLDRIKNASLPDNYSLVAHSGDDLLRVVDGAVKKPLFNGYEDIERFVRNYIWLYKDKEGEWDFTVTENDFPKVKINVVYTDYDWLADMNDNIADYFDYETFYDDIKDDEQLVDELVDMYMNNYDNYGDEV